MHEPTEPDHLEQGLRATLLYHQRDPGAGFPGVVVTELAEVARAVLAVDPTTCQVDARDLRSVLTALSVARPVARATGEWKRLDEACTPTETPEQQLADSLFTVRTVLDLLAEAQTTDDVATMTRLMREAADLMDARSARLATERDRAEHRPGPEPEPDEGRPHRVLTAERLRGIAHQLEAGIVPERHLAIRDLRAIALDYEGALQRESGVTAKLERYRRLADERGRYIEALETTLCPDGVPQAVTRAVAELRERNRVESHPAELDEAVERVLSAHGIDGHWTGPAGADRGDLSSDLADVARRILS